MLAQAGVDSASTHLNSRLKPSDNTCEVLDLTRVVENFSIAMFKLHSTDSRRTRNSPAANAAEILAYTSVLRIVDFLATDKRSWAEIVCHITVVSVYFRLDP